MSKIDKMSVKEILEITNGIVFQPDIVNLYTDKDKKTREEIEEIVEKIKLFYMYYDKVKGDNKEVRKYLSNNCDGIDKEKLVLTIYYNYRNNMDRLEKRMASKFGVSKDEKEKYYLEKKAEEKYLKECIKLLKDTDAYISFQRKDDKKQKYELEVVSSKEILGRKISDKGNAARIRQIDNEIANCAGQEISENEENDSSIYILQTLLLSDLAVIMNDSDMGMKLREVILDNAVLKEKNMTYEELEKLKDDDFSKYSDIVDNVKAETYLPILREELIKNSRFIDVDKLLLLGIYRFEEYIEISDVDENNTKFIIEAVSYMLSKIKDKNVLIQDKIDDKVDNDKKVEINYTYKDAEKFILRYIDDKYYRREEFKDFREDVISGKIEISKCSDQMLESLDLNNEEIDKIMNYSTANFAYMIELMKYTEEDIIKELMQKEEVSEELIEYLIDAQKFSGGSIVKLYSLSMLSKENVKKAAEKIDFSDVVNIERINGLYINGKFIENEEEKAQNNRLLEKHI